MTRSVHLRVYMAMSLDGRVSDATGGVGWLDPFNRVDYGYDEFFESVGALVMGRATYDQVRDLGEWPYRKRPCWVLTSAPLDADAPGPVEAWGRGPEELLERWRAEPPEGDVWVVGGPQTIQAFQELDAISGYQLYLVPTVLGAGLPMFPDPKAAPRLRLRNTRSFSNGVVELDYRTGAPPLVEVQPPRPAVPLAAKLPGGDPGQDSPPSSTAAAHLRVVPPQSGEEAEPAGDQEPPRAPLRLTPVQGDSEAPDDPLD